ncbi:class I SAM-dependent methyltransferase [Paenibacillus sp. SI8]|uniref:class I SAM-dependent methyltransferase n=1 Tax=unclassified Paenibacillus TaxID=185978 RepID=UPI003467C71A
MKIDLGCGANKHPHYFGIDLRPMPGVDLVCDINRPLPLPDDSVYFVMASRSLCYVNDLMAVMAELYRICTHKSIVCILAPYAHSFPHMSNPFIKQKFDEYTPRYVTSHFFQPPHGPICPPLSGYMPDLPVPIDFRLLQMEFFYQSPFQQPLYDPDELEVLKSLQANVVNEIMYHFVVVKYAITTEELEWLSKQTYPEPLAVTELRNKKDDGGYLVF